MPLQHALLACNVPGAERLIAAGANTSFALADEESIALARRRCPAQVDTISALAARGR